MPRTPFAAAALASMLLITGGSVAGQDADEPLTVYAGRSESLVGPVIDAFTEASGVPVEVKYADTAELAAILLEEGDRSPADVFFAQDAGALGAVADAGLLAELSAADLARVPAGFNDPDGQWVGVSGRARTVAYYAYRLVTRGLVGGKERLQTTVAGLSASTRVMATRDEGSTYLTVLQVGAGAPTTIALDLAEVGIGSGTATV